MDIINLILIPALIVITIIYIFTFSRYYKNKSRVVFNNSVSSSYFTYFTPQELLSSQSKYVPLFLSRKVPDYSKYSKENNFPLFKTTKKNSLNGINFFLNLIDKGCSDNIHHLILGSAGIGKTTFLINLYTEVKKQNTHTLIELIPLRVVDLDTILDKTKEKKSETVLLLDGIDEIILTNPDMLNTILNLTSDYKLVVLTSRTEFFYDNDINENIELQKFSGNKKYKLNKFYIVPFSEKDVNHYLKLALNPRNDGVYFSYFRAFIYYLFGNPQVIKAKSILSKVQFASLRPLFLYYITDIVNELADETLFDFQVYDILMSKWIERECYDLGDATNFKSDFNTAIESIAYSIYQNKRNYLDIHELKNLLDTQLSNKLLDISNKTKSLLIKNEQNRFYFFHNSIYEYIMAKISYKAFIQEKLMNKYILKSELFKHLNDEILAKYLFIDSNLIEGDISNSSSSNFTFLLKNISKLSELKKSKYLKIIKCKTDLQFLSLMPNIEYLQFKTMSEDHLVYLHCLKKLNTLDVTDNNKIINLSQLKLFPNINNINISDSKVDIDSLLSNKKLKKIIVSKNQYPSETLKKFPDKLIRYYIGGIIEVSISSKSAINSIIRRFDDLFRLNN